MEMINSKKSMYFTMMTIAFLVIFMFVFMVPSYTRLTEQMSAVEMRVDSMNDFIRDVERDVSRGLYIASYRALFAIEDDIASNGSFIKGFDSYFKEAVLNGTLKGENSSIMKDSTFSSWTEKIESESLKFNIYMNISVNDIKVYQKDPWYVSVDANLSIDVADFNNIASWDIEKIIGTSVEVTGFEDPLYIVNGLGRITNIINRTIYEGNYTYKIGGEWNTTNLITHVENSLYTANPDAPNFLMRFENNLSASPYGIESCVNLQKFYEQNLEIDTSHSVVDYVYWAGSHVGNYRINSTPSWIKFDLSHLEKYNLTELAYS